jgi:A/G-specific adenine glycosylase
MFQAMQKRKCTDLEIRNTLKHWYTLHHRKLPWRQTEDPYKIWISEIMLQQTTVQAVIPTYKRWFKLFPDIHTLSEAPLQKVLRAWQGLGYYQRAKNLHQASKIIVERHGGRIPQNYQELKSIPGFGPYTTAAVLSFAFDKPYPVMDANIRRVCMRLIRMHRKASPKNDKELLHFITPLLPQKNMGIFNQALMELGSLVCKPKNPLCLLCPISEYCDSFKKGEQEIIPHPKKRKYNKIEAVVGIIKKQGKYLIQKRPSKGLLADLWEFPGGKIRANEKPEEALKREIKEELGTDVSPGELLITVEHAYTQFLVKLSAYLCTVQSGLIVSKKNHRWVTLKSIRDFPLPSGSFKIVKHLEERERQSHTR